MNTYSDIKAEFHKKGIRLCKQTLPEKLQEKIRTDLKVIPFTLPSSMQEKKPFYAYRESPKYMYVPRMYANKELGIEFSPRIDCTPKQQSTFEFTGSLRDYQVNIVNTYLEKAEKTGCGLLEIPCGRGKCLGKNTPVLMFDGTTKMVQHIRNGDSVVGDKGEERVVSGVTKGIANMYRVCQYNAMDYTVNDEHIMTVWDTAEKKLVDMQIKKLFDLQTQTIRFTQIKGVKYDMKTKEYVFTTITIHEIDGLNYYYGFCVDGNHRFLLGDGTVTHNTVMALNIISNLKTKTPRYCS